jgi:hypothetical protein
MKGVTKMALPNQRIEPLPESAVLLVLDSAALDALPVMAHPHR